MVNTAKKSSKLAALLKRTAQKLVTNPKAIHKELKKLALTLPLMALLVEEVRAAQKKVSIDDAAVTGEVFEDEAALAEFIDAQNLDPAQYTEIEEELEGVLLAKADQAEVADVDRAAHIPHHDAVLSEEHLFGDGGMSLTEEDRAAALLPDADAAFEPAGLPAVPAALGGLLGGAAGVVGAAAVITNQTDTTVNTPTETQAEGTNLTTSLKDLQKLGVDFVSPAAGKDTINVALGAGDALTSTTGVPLFGDTNRDGIISAAEDLSLNVNLTITSAAQLAEVAALGNLSSFGIDSVRIDLADQTLLDTLVSDNTLTADLAAIRSSGLTIDTINMGANASITDAQAVALNSNSLHFVADDTITLNATAGTHLSTSLKDLQKLGVDAVNIAGDAGQVTVDFDSASTPSSTFSATGLPAFGTGLDVTLNVDGTQLSQLTSTGVAAALVNTAHIDNLHVNLTDSGAAGYDNELSSLLGTSGLNTLNAAHLNTVIDLGGSGVIGAVGISDAQASILVTDGLHFATEDTITLNTTAGTHLSTSLKDLQKLGVDAVSIAGDVGQVTVDFDSASTPSSTFSATGLPAFGAGLDVTLNVDATQLSQVTSTGVAAALVNTAHVDNLHVNLTDSGAAGYANELSSLLGTSGLNTLNAAHLNTVIDLGGGGVIGAVRISQAQAGQLIADGLHFAAADSITLDATLTAGNTHLGTSLKDLNKLGVDAVAVTGSDVVSVDLGGLTVADLGTNGHIASFADALNVTLNVANSAEFDAASGIASQLHTAHIDSVKIDVAQTDSNPDFFVEVDSLLQNISSAIDQFSSPDIGIATVLDLGGANVHGELTVNTDIAQGLLQNGIGFAVNDQIEFETAMQLGAHSTHLGSTLKDLHKLGVDAVSVTGAVAGDELHIDFGTGSVINLAQAGLPQFTSNLDVTVHAANGSQLNELGTLANTDGVDLGALGIDLVQLNLADQNGFDALMASEPTLTASLAATPPVTTLSGAVEALRTDHVEINTIDMVSNVVSLTDTQAAFLLDHGLHFAANDVVTVEASGTHLSTSLRELKALGIETTVAMGATDSLSVSLGDGPNIDNSFFNGLPSFDSDFNLTLEVANSTQLQQVTQNINSFQGIGVDEIQLNFASQSELSQFLFEDTLAGLPSTSLMDRTIETARNQGAVTLDTIDMGGYTHEGVAHLTADQMGSVIDAGLHFAAADYVTVDVSLDVASTFHSAGVTNLAQFGVDTVHITDAENITSTSLLNTLVTELKTVGVNKLGISSSDFEASSAMTSTVKAFNWLASGADFALQVDTGSTAAPQNLGSLINMVQNGVDVLTGNSILLAPDAKWGDLIDTLQAAGLGNVELETSAKVHISDDLSAALYESGMLHALPDAAIAIDAGVNKVLNTSLKAMADLGVDSVNTNQKVYVELGLSVDDAQTLAELGDVFSAFGLDSPAPDTQLFGAQGAGLVVDQATFDNFNSMDPAMVEVLLGDLNKLGFTEVDVMGATEVSAVYQINVTAQTPVLSQVALIGTNAINDLAHVFDPDILNKPLK